VSSQSKLSLPEPAAQEPRPEQRASARLGIRLREVGILWREPAFQRWLAWIVVLALVAIDIAVVGRHTLVRYQAYRADAFDLGNMDQAVWNTLHGHPFRFTNRGLDWYGPPTRLGIHVEPLLLLIAPLYLLHSGPETLVVLQTVALALGALPLFALARRRLPALPFVGCAFVVAYLIAPQLLGEALWDFHAVALATPLLLLALWALDARRYGWFAVAALLAALTKEDVALSLIPLGLYIAVWRGRPRFGGAVIVLSLTWVACAFFIILPHFNGGASGGNNYWYRYAWLGSSPVAALDNILAHPWLPVAYVLGDPARRAYLTELLRTGGGFGLLAPVLWICALPELAVNVLSAHEEQYSGFFQYNAVLLPYLLAAGVYGAGVWYRARAGAEAKAGVTATNLPPAEHVDGQAGEGDWTALVRHAAREVGRTWSNLLGHVPIPTAVLGPLFVAWLLACALWNLSAADLRVSAFWNAGDAPSPQQAQVDALLARIPAGASVAATDSLNPHVSDRYDLYLMPDPLSYKAEWVALDINSAIPSSRDDDRHMYAAMRASGSYVEVGRVGSVILLHRVGPSPGAP
jgi:uncharacterized membrane protein